MKSSKYTFWWSDKMSMLPNESYLETFIKDKDLVKHRLNNVVFAAKNKTIDFYFSTTGLKRAEKFGDKKFSNSRYTLKFFQQLDKDIGKFWKMIKIISLKNYPALTNGEIINLLEQFYREMVKIWKYFIISQAEFFYSLESKFKEKLSKKFDPSLLDDYFTTLITPTDLDRVNAEQVYWIRLINKKVSKNNLQDYLWNHLRKYPALYRNVWEKKDILKLLQNRYKTDLKQRKIKRKEIQTLLQKKSELKEKQKTILKEVDKDIKYFAWLFQKWGIKRFDVKFCWAGAEIYLENFLKELAKRINVDFYEMMWFYRKSEIIKALKNGVKLSNEEIEKRNRFFLFYILNNRLYFKTGKVAEGKSFQLLKDNLFEESLGEFRGQIASKGKVRGIVKIIHSGDPEELSRGIKKFKKGNILITEMTQVEMVPLVKKASGIITDGDLVEVDAEKGVVRILSKQGGSPLKSHKAGQRRTTQVLKDGDLVKVDAKRGIVRKL